MIDDWIASSFTHVQCHQRLTLTLMYLKHYRVKVTEAKIKTHYFIVVNELSCGALSLSIFKNYFFAMYRNRERLYATRIKLKMSWRTTRYDIFNTKTRINVGKF